MSASASMQIKFRCRMRQHGIRSDLGICGTRDGHLGNLMLRVNIVTRLILLDKYI